MGVKSFFNGLYQRLANGDNYYFVHDEKGWGLEGNNLHIAQHHPILTPALLFVSKIFSQANFELINETTEKKVTSHNILDLLKNPNHYQTSIDFLETLMFMMIAQGYAVVYKKRVPGGLKYNSMYVLNPDLIKWPDNYKMRMASRSVLEKSNDSIIYDANGDNRKIKINDLLFFYDSPNALNKNPFTCVSRLEGLKQTLQNTHDSLLAKNIILKTNGKELITGSKGSNFPLTPEEKSRLETIYQSNYGLSKRRKRAIITRSDVTHKSLHIALRDLGLDESIKVDGNLIYTALHIPKDILSLEAKKTTYNNFKESMVSFIQNEMQGSLDAIAAVFQKDIKETNLKLKGNYNHLPVMQFVLLEKYKMVKLRGEALDRLRKAGLPDEEALRLCDFDSTIKLTELSKPEENEQEGSQQQTEQTEE